MCFHSLKNTGKVFLLLLVLFSLSLAVYSQETPEDSFLKAAQEIVALHPDMKPQISQMASALRKMSDESSQQSQTLKLQVTGLTNQVATLQDQVTDLKTSQTDSTNSHLAVERDLRDYAATLSTQSTIFGTVAAISIGANVVQFIAYSLKK